MNSTLFTNFHAWIKWLSKPKMSLKTVCTVSDIQLKSYFLTGHGQKTEINLKFMEQSIASSIEGFLRYIINVVSVFRASSENAYCRPFNLKKIFLLSMWRFPTLQTLNADKFLMTRGSNLLSFGTFKRVFGWWKKVWKKFLVREKKLASDFYHFKSISKIVNQVIIKNTSLKPFTTCVLIPLPYVDTVKQVYVLQSPQSDVGDITKS